MKKIRLFVRGIKGLSVIQLVIEAQSNSHVELVVIDMEKGVQEDYASQIEKLCQQNKINYKFHNVNDTQETQYALALAVGWQHMLPAKNLLVLHDSLLPKYRGFNPLVSMLINGENKIGATLILASEAVDAGDIVFQKAVDIKYPLPLRQALEIVCEVYKEITTYIFDHLKNDRPFSGTAQDHTEATYSLWRNEDDYQIDWTQSAELVERFVNAVGYPYAGAASFVEQKKIHIFECDVIPDVKIENRKVGKVFLIDKQGCPIIVCGKGLIKITKARYADDNSSAVPFKRLKVKLR